MKLARNNNILAIKEKAFFGNDLIKNIGIVIENPRKMKLITGDIAKEIIDENGEIVPVNSIITGKVIFGGKSSE